jgi:hypothetical protein
MLEYNFFENLTIEEINVLGDEGWEITGVIVNASPQTFSVFAQKGFQDKTLIENVDTGAKFWVNQNYSYGETMILIFVVIWFFIWIGGKIFNFIFKND